MGCSDRLVRADSRERQTSGAAPSLLLTDLYQLAMMQAYLEHGETEPAVFEMFVRRLPPSRGFLVAAGLEQAVEFLRSARFAPEELDWLAASGKFSRALIDYLSELRFTGHLDATAEGAPVFADEPILRVTAPLPVAQLMETRLVNILHFQTVVASKAARMVLAAKGRPLIDFGLRRAHGAEAGLLAARAAYLAGFAGTATVLAAQRFGIPAFGTMAHSFIQAHDDELTAFERFARTRPDGLVLLIDTYDTEAAAGKVVRLAPKLKAAGIELRGVRIDSGDLDAHARQVRRILDLGGLRHVTIVASGGLDETQIQRLVEGGAPIDSFGVGTSLTTSEDAPALDCAYKLQEYRGVPRRKKSEGKTTWPGGKQVYRRYSADGMMLGDVVARLEEPCDGAPLLQPVLRAGELVRPLPSLETARSRTAVEMTRLPRHLAELGCASSYPVEISPGLRALARELDARPGR